MGLGCLGLNAVGSKASSAGYLCNASFRLKWLRGEVGGGGVVCDQHNQPSCSFFLHLLAGSLIDIYEIRSLSYLFHNFFHSLHPLLHGYLLVHAHHGLSNNSILIILKTIWTVPKSFVRWSMREFPYTIPTWNVRCSMTVRVPKNRSSCCT